MNEADERLVRRLRKEYSVPEIYEAALREAIRLTRERTTVSVERRTLEHAARICDTWKVYVSVDVEVDDEESGWRVANALADELRKEKNRLAQEGTSAPSVRLVAPEVKPVSYSLGDSDCRHFVDPAQEGTK